MGKLNQLTFDKVILLSLVIIFLSTSGTTWASDNDIKVLIPDFVSQSSPQKNIWLEVAFATTIQQILRAKPGYSPLTTTGIEQKISNFANKSWSKKAKELSKISKAHRFILGSYQLNKKSPPYKLILTGRIYNSEGKKIRKAQVINNKFQPADLKKQTCQKLINKLISTPEKPRQTSKVSADITSNKEKTNGDKKENSSGSSPFKPFKDSASQEHSPGRTKTDSSRFTQNNVEQTITKEQSLKKNETIKNSDKSKENITKLKSKKISTATNSVPYANFSADTLSLIQQRLKYDPVINQVIEQIIAGDYKNATNLIDKVDHKITEDPALKNLINKLNRIIRLERKFNEEEINID